MMQGFTGCRKLVIFSLMSGGSDFTIVISKDGGENGADVATVIRRLRAFESLYEDLTLANLQPGKLNRYIPKVEQPLTKLIISGAKTTNSLAVYGSTPQATHLYAGVNRDLPSRTTSTMRDLFGVVSRNKLAEVSDILPKPIDQFRAMKQLQSLCPSKDDLGDTEILGDIVSSPIVFVPQLREKIISAVRQPDPEFVSIKGVIRQGHLGEHTWMEIYDGDSNIRVIVPAELRERSAELLGHMVSVQGEMQYRKNCLPLHIQNIDHLDETSVGVEETISGTTRLIFSRPIEFKSTASLDMKYFTLENDDLGIYACEKSLFAATEQVKAELAMIWAEYVVTDDLLHESGQRLAHRFRALVGRTEEIQ
jgi:hypothetical protein